MHRGNAGRLAASGVIKLTAGTAADLTGVGVVPGTLAIGLGVMNLRGAAAALDKSFLLGHEAMNENWSDATYRNFAGLLPMGQYYDDPWEPGPIRVIEGKLEHVGCLVGEVLTLSP